MDLQLASSFPQTAWKASGLSLWPAISARDMFAGMPEDIFAAGSMPSGDRLLLDVVTALRWLLYLPSTLFTGHTLRHDRFPRPPSVPRLARPVLRLLLRHHIHRLDPYCQRVSGGPCLDIPADHIHRIFRLPACPPQCAVIPCRAVCP